MAARREACARTGEEAAARYLTERGYTVLARNLRVGRGEADMVALTPEGSVAIIEVKTRSGPWHGEERVDGAKRTRLLRLSAALARDPRMAGRLFQFDVVAVELRPERHGASSEGADPLVRIRHFPHAFDASDSPW